MYVVLRDLGLGEDELGAVLAADEREWCAGRPEIAVFRGPDHPAELLPAGRLEELPCALLEVGQEGFWECGEPESSLGLGEASSRKRTYKKKGFAKKKSFKRKKGAAPRRPGLPELTQAMWAMVFPEAFQAPPPGTRLRYQPSEDAPRWIHGLDLDPASFFDMDEVWTLTRQVVQDPRWDEMVKDCREGLDMAMFPIALIADGGGNQAYQIARFFKIPESVMKKSRGDLEEDVVQPFAAELSEAIEQMKPPGFPGRFEFGYTDANEYGLIYVDC